MQAPERPSRQRVLDVAEELFSTRGYTAVRLRDIADVLGVKHAALYYHAPGGKEQLYVDVMARMLQRHRVGMEAAIASAGGGVREQMQAVADWLLAHPPLNLARMETPGSSKIDPENARMLSMLAFDALRLPLVAALETAQQQGIVDLVDPNLAAITFVTLVETVHGDTTPEIVAQKPAVIERLIDMLLRGWLAR